MRYLAFAFIFLIIFSCKQKDKEDSHIDVIDTQMAELKKEPPFAFKDSLKCLEFWNDFYETLLVNDTNGIIKMSLQNVYCPIYFSDYNYYQHSKLMPLWFFLHAPYRQNYVKAFSPLLQNARSTIYHSNQLDTQQANDLGFPTENNIKGFSVYFDTKEIAGNYQLRKTHQFRFIESNGSFKFIGLEIYDNGSRYLYESMPLDSLYFPVSSLDTFTNRWYSKYLLQFQEPILHKTQSVNEVYRFTWLRSFNNPVVIRFEKFQDKYTLYTKEMLDYGGRLPSVLKINTQQQMSAKAWKVLKEKLNEIDFENLVSKDPAAVPNDGAVWILENSTRKRYHFTERNYGDKQYRACGRYLLLLSKLHIPEKEIY